MLKIGDIVNIEKGIDNNIKWEIKPDTIIIESITKLGENWTVANINGIYSHVDGSTSSQILLEYLKVDIMETRNLIIDKLLE